MGAGASTGEGQPTSSEEAEKKSSEDELDEIEEMDEEALREALELRGLPRSGKRQVLIRRLRKAVSDGVAVRPSAAHGGEPPPAEAPPPPPGGADSSIAGASAWLEPEPELEPGPDAAPNLALTEETEQQDDEEHASGLGGKLLVATPKRSPSPTPSNPGVAADEIALWRGQLETIKSVKKGAYKWQTKYGVVWGSESFVSWNPRIEIYKDFKTAQKALRSPGERPSSPKKGIDLLYPLGTAQVHRETEDKYDTVLLAFRQAGEAGVEEEGDAPMRLRLDDKKKLGEPTTPAKLFQDAITNAMAPPPDPEPDSQRTEQTDPSELSPRSSLSTSDFGSSEWEMVIENDAASRIQAARRGQLARRRMRQTELGGQLNEDTTHALAAMLPRESTADRDLSERLSETRTSIHSRSTLNTSGPLLFNEGEPVEKVEKEQKAMQAIEKAKQDEIDRLKGEVQEWDISIELNKQRAQDEEIKRLREEVAQREKDFAALLEERERENEKRIAAEKKAEEERLRRQQEADAAAKIQAIERGNRTRKALEHEKAERERREQETAEYEAQIREAEAEVQALANARQEAEAAAKARVLQEAELAVAQANAAEEARLLAEQEALEQARRMAEAEAARIKAEAEAARVRRQQLRNSAAIQIQRVERGRQARAKLSREQQAKIERHRLWQLPLRERRRQWELRLATEKEAALAQKRRREQNRAATKIQSRWRGIVTRRVVTPLILQAREEELKRRQREETRLLRERREREKNEAAARIQAIQRGKNERRRVEELRKQRAADEAARLERLRIESEERAEQEAAARRIQAIQRGKQTRAAQQAAREARLERQAREAARKEHDSIARVQAMQRGKIGRRKVVQQREETQRREQEKAAIRIQAVHRGKMGRRLSPQRRLEPRIAARTKRMEQISAELPGQWVLIEGGEVGQVLHVQKRPDSAPPEVRMKMENGKEVWRGMAQVAKVYGQQKPGARSMAGAIHLAVETEKIARRISPQRARPGPATTGQAGSSAGPGGTVPVGSIFHLLPEADQNMQSRINTRVQHLGPGLDHADRRDGAPDGYEWETESEVPDTPDSGDLHVHRYPQQQGTRIGTSPPRVHTRGAYHLSSKARMQREHAAVLHQIQQIMQSQRSLNGKTISDTRGVFLAIDRDNSGTLDPGEFADAMRRLGLGLTPQQVGGLARALDRDGDGAIDYEELLDYLHGNIPVPGPKDFDEDGFLRDEEESVRSISPPQRSRSPQVLRKGVNGMPSRGGRTVSFGAGPPQPQRGDDNKSPMRGRPPGMGNRPTGGQHSTRSGNEGPMKVVRDSGDKPWGDNKVSNQIPAWMLERKKQAEEEAAAAKSKQNTKTFAGKADEHQLSSSDGATRPRSPPIPTHRPGGSRFGEQSPATSFDGSDDEALQLAGGLNAKPQDSSDHAQKHSLQQQQRAKIAGPIGQSIDGQASLHREEGDEENPLDNDSLAGSEYSARSSAYSMSHPGTPPSMAHRAGLSALTPEDRARKNAHARRVLKGVCRFGDGMLRKRVTQRLGPDAAEKERKGEGPPPAAPPQDTDWIEIGRTECIQDTSNPRFATSLVVARLGAHAKKNLTVRWLQVKVLDVDGDGVDLSKDDLCGEATLDVDVWLGELSQDADARAADTADFADLQVAIKEVPLRRPQKGKKKPDTKTYGTVRMIAEPLRRIPGAFQGSASGAVRVSMRGMRLVNVEGFLSKSDPFCTLSRALPAERDDQAQRWVTCYRTEWVKNSLDPMWQPFDVPLSAVCGGDRDTTRALRLQVFDYEKSGDHRLLGEVTTTVADLLALRSEVDQSGGSAAELVLAWPKEGPLAEKVQKAKKKGKATEEAGSLLFDVFSLLPGTANDPVATSAASVDEDQYIVSIEADNLPKMDTMSKSDPIAVISVQETVPAPKAADATLLGKMRLQTARRNVSLATVMAKTPDFRAANRV